MSGSFFNVSVVRSRRLPAAFAAAVFALLALSTAAHAASFTVNDVKDAPLANSAGTTCVSTDTGGTCTLRAAVQAADNLGGANTITLPAGSYGLTIASTGADDPTTGDLDVKNFDSLTINGAGASSTTINANQIDRAFSVDSGSALSLSGVTITGGSPSSLSTTTGDQYGGDIYSAGTLTVSSSVFEDSTATDGGAIFNDSGTLTLSADTLLDIQTDVGGGVYLEGGSLIDTGSTFTGLAAFDEGGALYATGATTSVSFTNSTFSDDNSGEGGAIDMQDGTLSVTGATFADDYASESAGGGIYADSSGAMTVSGSLFSGDGASGDGGAIDEIAGSGSITGTHFTDNGAADGGALYADGTGLTVSLSQFDHDNADYGGGIYAEAGTLSVTQSTLSHETAGYEEGGGLYLATAGSVMIANTTLSDNRAGSGGGVEIDNGAPSFVNDTIAGNQARAEDGGGINAPVKATGIENTIIADNTGGDCSASAGAADLGNNLDSDGSCFTGTGASGDHVGVNPVLGPLESNGGPGPTQELLSGSPAIDGGNASACAAAPVSGVDELGVTRPQGTSCDIGAVEAAAADMAISQTAPASAFAGTPITYTLTVVDNGPGPAGAVTVTDALPAGTTYFDSSASQGSCSGTSPVICSLGALGKGATATITIRVVAGGSGSITNVATVSAAQTDPNSANNVTSATTAVSAGPTVTVAVFTKPVVLTGVASQVTTSKAKLSAIINPAGQSTTYSIQYGTSKKYGKTAKGKTLAAGTTPKGVVISVKGLKAGKTYDFRIVAKNATGTSYGQNVTFKTKKAKKKPKKKK